MRIKLLGKNIAIKSIAKEEIKSGIILPETIEKEKPEQGEVIAVGSEIKDVKIGDMVIFKKYSPDEYKIDDESFLVVDYKDVLVVLEE